MKSFHTPYFRRLLLVSLDWTRPKDPRVPLGHGSIIAAVKRDSPQIQLTSLEQHVNSFRLESARYDMGLKLLYIKYTHHKLDT